MTRGVRNATDRWYHPGAQWVTESRHGAMHQTTRTLLFLLPLATLACGSFESSTVTAMEHHCSVYWNGGVPSGSRQLMFDACLNERRCSGPLEVNLDGNVGNPLMADVPGCNPAEPADDAVCAGIVAQPSRDGNDWFRLEVAWRYQTTNPGRPANYMVVSFMYAPAFGRTINPVDRASLKIQDGNGDLLVDAVAQSPYQSRPYTGDDDPGAICLDGDYDFAGAPYRP